MRCAVSLCAACRAVVKYRLCCDLCVSLCPSLCPESECVCPCENIIQAVYLDAPEAPSPCPLALPPAPRDGETPAGRVAVHALCG